jgi:hypothetical protein
VSGRHFFYFILLCFGGPFVVLFCLAQLRGSDESIEADRFSITEPRNVEPSAGVATPMTALITPAHPLTGDPSLHKVPVVPQAPRVIDTHDPWTGEELSIENGGSLHHRYVSRQPRPIDVSDPWDPSILTPPANGTFANSEVDQPSGT